MNTGIVQGNLLAWVAAVGTVLVAAGSLQAQQAQAAASPQAEAKAPAAVWQAIESESIHPTPPKEWQNAKPSEEVIQAWVAKETNRLTALADRARDFAAQFPKDAHASAARITERQAVGFAARLSGDKALAKRLDTLDTALLSDASVPPEDRYGIRLSKAKSREEAEQIARAFVKEFPQNPQASLVLLQVAKGGGPEHFRLVAGEIVKSAAPEEIKAEAQKILNSAERTGKPLALQFTALDGKAIDLRQLKGKVVLIDFWATWCGPCVGEIPNVKAAYAKLHPKGFEILGISFDQDKETLAQFLKEKGMTWPQYFDGQGWKNRFGQEFGIDSIPTMWLVDKKGVLRDMEAREDLAGKVEKLLAEP